METLYRVWADSESSVEVPMDVVTDWEDLETACDVARRLAEEHDGESYWAIFHVEDVLNEETVYTYKNVPY